MTEPAEHVYSAPREWARVHPVSPLLGGWAAFAAVAGVWFSNNPMGFGGESVPDEDGMDAPFVGVAVAAVVAAIIAITYGYLNWRFHTFRITDEAIEQRKGLVFKQQKQARLERLQAVDVVQPLLGRIFGFAAITIEVAGGANSRITLKFLRLADAEALRNEIVALAAGEVVTSAVTGADAGERAAAAVPVGARLKSQFDSFHLAPAPGSARTAVAASVERPLVAVPVSRLVGSILLSWGTIGTAIAGLFIATGTIAAGVLAPEIDVAEAFFGGGFIGILSGVAGSISYLIANLNRGLNFRLGIARDGVRVAHGLVETRRQTIPPGRVQAVHFSQPFLWRGRDWWKITVNVAGYQDDQQAVAVLLPVGSRSDALTTLWAVLPDLGEPDPASVVALALSGTGAEGGFTPAPASAKVLDPVQWRQRGVRATETALFVRAGRLTRELIVVPHARTQSLALRQGPWQRWLGLADVHIHSTKGAVKPVARHLAFGDAVTLLEEQAVRARARRERESAEEWMEKVGLLEAATPAAPATPPTPATPATSATPATPETHG